MQGARKYARLFKTGQYGRLYLVSGERARDKTHAPRVQACRPGDRAMLATPAGAELLAKVADALGATDDA